MAYLIASQGTCTGISEEKADQLMGPLSELERVWTHTTRAEYLQYREVLADLTAIGSNPSYGYRPEVMPEEDWLANDPDNEDWWNPTLSAGRKIPDALLPAIKWLGC